MSKIEDRCSALRDGGFRRLLEGDLAHLRELFWNAQVRSYEYNMATVACWDHRAQYWLRETDGSVYLFSARLNLLMFPVRASVDPLSLRDISRELTRRGLDGRIQLVPIDALAANPGLRDYFVVDADRDHANYLYESSSLVTLRGERLHKKRAHVERFKREYPSWRVEMLTEHDRGECLTLFDRWARASSVAYEVAQEEREAIEYALSHLQAPDMEGLTLRVDEHLVAFVLFGAQRSDMMVTHFEKADATFEGVYQVINRLAAEEAVRRGYRWINRADDLGIPGLRQAKLSYQPSEILEVFRLTPLG